ncbi:SusC/RagA family TonB-linked outer membrane protein [Flavitalea antarctica]
MKKRLHFAFLGFVFCCVFNLPVFAQQKVSGTVTSRQDNTPLSGATIQVKGTSISTISDKNGQFTIAAGVGQSLIVSFVDFQQSEVKIDSTANLMISLQKNDSRLDDVVVVGYGTARRKDLSGSVATISGEEIKSAPIASFEQGLQGRVSGVQVVQGNSAPGGAPQVRVRGANTVLGGNEPLYVIDGVPLYNSTLQNNNDFNTGTQPSNALAAINPNDIVSMEVLKDASATAIYGARGANGVVIITTKRGRASDKGKMTLESYYGHQTPLKKLDLMNSQEIIAIANEKSRNTGAATLFYPDSATSVKTNTDWQDLLMQDAPIQNYNLSFSGGTPASLYNISGNYFNQEGVLVNTGFKRYAVRGNFDNRIGERLKISTSLSANRSETKRTSIYWLGLAIGALPTFNPYNADGSYADLRPLPNGMENPVEGALKNSDVVTVNRFLGNVLAEYTIFKDLTYGLRVGLDYQNQLNDVIVKPGNYNFPFPVASVSNTYDNNYLIENIFNYSHSFKSRHRINATAGYTWQKNVSRFFQQSGTGFQFDFGTDNLGAAAVTNPNVSQKNEWALLSYLGRFNYILDDKYIVTLTGRADGSSRFGPNNKWGYFPSGAVAWRVSKEKFMEDISFISDLKLRASYGWTGNQEIGLYNSISRMGSVTTVFGNPLVANIAYVPVSLANPDLKWEVNKQFDLGLDLGLFQNKLSLVLEYYHKRTDDLLANLPIAGSSGFSSILINSGSIENKGFEVSVNSTIVDKKDLNWSVNANFSKNNTKVLDLAVSSNEFFAPNLPSAIDAPVNIIKEGEVLSAFYGYKEDGLTATGDIKYVDLNKDGKIDGSDRTILGSPFPDFIYGFSSNLTVKDFYLTVFLQGVSGVQVFNSNDFLLANSFVRPSQQLKEVTERWTAANPNPNAKYPRTSAIQNLISERFVQDADYLRLRNIVLGYNLPVAKMKVGWLDAARFYVSAQNLFTITDYHGYDPEVASTSSSSLVKGVDRFSYPSAKTFTVGFNVTFK